MSKSDSNKWRAAAIGAVAVAFALAHGSSVGCAGVPPCERNSDCAEGYCVDGECKVDCVVAEFDCPKGYICNALGQCEYAGPWFGGSGPAGGTGGSFTGTSGGAAGATATGGSGATGGGGSSVGGIGGGGPNPGGGGQGGSAGLLQLLEVCSSDPECEGSLVCRAMVVSGTKRCTLSCLSDAQCPSGTRCLDPGGGAHCLGIDAGRYCNSATLCNFACLQPQNYCTLPCTNGGDCPNGYGCMPVGSPAQNACVKTEAMCSPSDTSACIAPAACDLSPSLILGSCTTACNTSADCPWRANPQTAWTCDGLCRRPNDVYGPLPGGFTPVEYHCDEYSQPVALCNDGRNQHIDFVQFIIPTPPAVDCQSSYTTAGVAGDACVNSCRYQGGCAYGFACTALGALGNERIGLCLPTGLGELGASCSAHTQCAFGYCNNGFCSRDCTADDVCPGAMTCTPGGAPPVEGMTFKRCE